MQNLSEISHRNILGIILSYLTQDDIMQLYHTNRALFICCKPFLEQTLGGLEHTHKTLIDKYYYVIIKAHNLEYFITEIEKLDIDLETNIFYFPLEFYYSDNIVYDFSISRVIINREKNTALMIENINDTASIFNFIILEMLRETKYYIRGNPIRIPFNVDIISVIDYIYTNYSQYFDSNLYNCIYEIVHIFFTLLFYFTRVFNNSANISCIRNQYMANLPEEFRLKTVKRLSIHKNMIIDLHNELKDRFYEKTFDKLLEFNSKVCINIP